MIAPITNLNIFLEMLGLKLSFMLLCGGICFTILITLLLLKWHGYFYNPKIYKTQLPQSHILYQRFQQKYENNWISHDKLKKQTEDTFKISRIFGQYQVDQLGIKNPKKVMGIIINAGQLNKIQKFRLQHPQYNYAKLPNIQCIGSDHPYPSALSSIFVFSKVYPLIRSVQETKTVSSQVMQIYQFLPGWPLQKINFYVAAEKLDDFNLWK